MKFGFIKINMKNKKVNEGIKVYKVMWSKKIKMGWYLNEKWESRNG
jgi:hypothetical protein